MRGLGIERAERSFAPCADGTPEGCDFRVNGAAERANIDEAIQQVSRVEEKALLGQPFLDKPELTPGRPLRGHGLSPPMRGVLNAASFGRGFFTQHVNCHDITKPKTTYHVISYDVNSVIPCTGGC